jgi:hypothetical protein
MHMSISLDGFVAGPDQSLEHPLGRRGIELHHWHLDEPLHEQREADAELARLTLRAQLAVLGQQALTPDRIRAMLDALADEAVKGSGHVRIQAARTLLDLIRAATDAEPTDPDAKPLESMTPEERIALYTRLLREEGSADGDPSPPGTLVRHRVTRGRSRACRPRRARHHGRSAAAHHPRRRRLNGAFGKSPIRRRTGV